MAGINTNAKANDKITSDMFLLYSRIFSSLKCQDSSLLDLGKSLLYVKLGQLLHSNPIIISYLQFIKLIPNMHVQMTVDDINFQITLLYKECCDLALRL